MTDITKCSNKECPLSVSCHRFLAESGMMQSYAMFTPRIDEELDEVECDYYWEIL